MNNNNPAAFKLNTKHNMVFWLNFLLSKVLSNSLNPEKIHSTKTRHL